MTEASTKYAVDFIERSLGLVTGSLREDLVPSQLIDELCSVMRGSPPRDTCTPSLDARIMGLLPGIEKDSVSSRGFFARKARWPSAAPFAVCLTHDIDNMDRPREHIQKVKDRFSKKDYDAWEKGTLSLYDNVAEIAKKEGELGFHSSFYYMSAEYPLAKAKSTAQKIQREGWEVGLHGDFGTHDSAEAMREAVDRLTDGVGIRPLGVREHYLRFDYAKTWPLLEDSGFDYDSTPGNTDALGFKLGLATPFHPPDSGWKAMRLLELPLSLMDTTLWGYLKKDEEEGLEDVVRFMDMVEEMGGLFTLLWHQEAVRMIGGRIYWKVLKKVERSGAFVGSGAEIANWWRAREVPLKVGKDSKLITLGGAAPRGLVIQLKTEEGTKVVSSSARRRGRTMDGHRWQEFSPLGSAFKLELSH